jgi:hypothetical protein
MGASSLYRNTSGDDNIAFSNQALGNSLTGSKNITIGAQNITDNTTGYNKTGIGFQFLQQNTTGSYNTAQGNNGQYLAQTAYNYGRVKYFGVITYTTGFDTNYYKITGQSVHCIKN